MIIRPLGRKKASRKDGMVVAIRNVIFACPRVKKFELGQW
jgi:hypothetical protein